MRKSVFFCIAAIVLAGCNRIETDNAINFGLPKVWAGVDVAETKTYVDGSLAMHWNANDVIDVYFANDGYQNGFEYTFAGADGAKEGEFTPPSGTTIEPSYGKDLAYFPSGLAREGWSESQASVRFWEYQEYNPMGSFGPKDNPMIAVSKEKDGKLFFPFQNICGYLVVRLYGNAKVEEVLLEGNNGEVLSGECSVIIESSTNLPFIVWNKSGFTQTWISVANKVNNVVTPLELGKTAAEATEFWFVVPPTTFKKGFTVTVRGSGLEEEMTISSPRQRKIERNVVHRMAPVEVVYDEDFEDAKFRAYCMDNFDTDSDGELSETEALAVTEIDCRGLGITSLKGINKFKNLETLRCGLGSDPEYATLYNNISGSLDLSVFTKLKVVDCSYNSLTALDVSGLTHLESLVCAYNHIEALDVSDLENLTMLNCSNNRLTSLDVSMLGGLKILNVGYNNMQAFDYSHNTALTELYVNDCGLTSVDLSMLPDLVNVGVSENKIETLDVSHNPNLEDISCVGCGLKELDLRNLLKLRSINCGYNELTTLDVSVCPSLQFIFASNNQLESIVIGEQNTHLWMVNVSYNKLSGEFDLSNSKDVISEINMFMLTLNNNTITKLWLPEGFSGLLSCDIKAMIEIGYK